MKKTGLLLLVLVFAGCTALQQMVQAPTVSMDDVKLQNFTFQQVTLDFGLNVNNPNVFGVQLLGFDYKFIIEDNEFLKGDESRTLDITPQAGSTIHIPVTVNFQDLYSLMTKVKSLDTLSYHLSGSFRPGGLLAGLNIPFSKKGSLPNIHIPKVNIKGIKIDKLSFSGVDLAVNLGLENSNIFGFDIGKMNYAINLAGNPVANGVTEKLASIPAKGNGSVTIPVSLNFSGLGSLYSLLTGSNVDCDISGNAELNSPFGAFNLPIEASQNVAIFR